MTRQENAAVFFATELAIVIDGFIKDHDTKHMFVPIGDDMLKGCT